MLVSIALLWIWSPGTAMWLPCAPRGSGQASLSICSQFYTVWLCLNFNLNTKFLVLLVKFCSWTYLRECVIVITAWNSNKQPTQNLTDHLHGNAFIPKIFHLLSVSSCCKPDGCFCLFYVPHQHAQFLTVTVTSVLSFCTYIDTWYLLYSICWPTWLLNNFCNSGSRQRAQLHFSAQTHPSLSCSL